MTINNQVKTITIISVSFNSGSHLGRLFANLNEKAESKENIKYLIVDNTNGNDKKLKYLLPDSLNIEVIQNNGEGYQRSVSHANGLDIGLRQSKTEYTLIIDPDVHVFMPNWDRLCVDYLSKGEKRIIGAPYPSWKLGKVHDYPSVVFMFFRTQEIKALDKSFRPFPSYIKRLRNNILRKINRLGFIASKNILDKSGFVRNLTLILEKTFGITSPDTGKDIIEAIRIKSFKSLNFQAYLGHQLDPKTACVAHYDLTKEFELYYHDDNPFMTHMYGSGVFYWKTKNGSDVHYWKKLIEVVEGEY